MEITQKLLHELFEYKDGTFYKKENGKEISTHLTGRGYLQTNLFKKSIFIHRLIFIYTYGYSPTSVDHINGNKLDNRPENLREASVTENNRNVGLRKDNSSGVKGVYWKKENKKWRAQIRVDGKRKHLGYFDDLELAELVAEEARNKYHGEFANHGKQKNEDSSGY